MKKSIVFIAAALLTAFQGFAAPAGKEELLQVYYNIKNALSEGDSKAASKQADMFLRLMVGVENIIPEADRNLLAKDAGKIAGTTDLKKQRNHFTKLSMNMLKVVKSIKMSGEPIYLLECNMKKAPWLSNRIDIRNPYYGDSMLNCGQIKETI